MDTERVKALLKNGQSPRQIAKQLGCSRTEVEMFARSRSRTRQTMITKSAFMVLVPALAIGLIAAWIHSSMREPTDLEVNRNIVRIADAVRPSSRGSSWFLETEQQAVEPAAMDAEIELIEKLTARINQVFKNNGDVYEVDEASKLFAGRIMPTIFFKGVTRHLTSKAVESIQPGLLEVVFFSHASFNHPIIGHRLLHYDPDWRTMIVAALKFTDEKWYDAMMSHELLHAVRHRQGAASATAPMLSDPWVDEELDAHHVEWNVLTARTDGAYNTKLTEIASRIRARSFQRFLSQLKPEDMASLEMLFTPAIPEETDIRAAQYLLDLAGSWAEKNSAGSEDLRQKRREIYRFLIQPRSTNVQ